MQVVVSSTDISPVGRKQEPLARIARVVCEFIQMDVYGTLFYLHVCFPIRFSQHEFGHFSI